MNMKRPITLLLALSLVLSCTGQWIVHAKEAEDPALDPTLTESAATATVVPADSQTLLAEDMPFLHFIDDDQFSNANHVARLPEEERLDTYVFLNQDGTKSVYHMGRNVKFVDADGIIKEKDTTLVAAKGGYTMRSNDVHLLLPQNASDGVFLSHSDHNVRLIPTGGNGKTVMSEDAILYADYYGDGIHLKYTPTLAGVKEDIILESYTGMSSFTFRLESCDLELYQRAGVWCLAPGEDAETVFTLGQIIVYDAIGKPVAGTMTVEPAENGAYVLTVSAPVEFLTDPTTVYPVTIDPTLQIKDSAGQLNIEDATIFSGYPYSNSGSFVYNTIGYTDANYQIGRLAVRLTGLLSDSTYQGLTVDEIVKVTFNIKDGGSYYSGVNIHAIVGNSTWTESSVRWIDIPSYSSEVYATATMGGSYWASFDITNLVKDWKTGAQNGQCGFLMVGVNEDTKKIGTISCEYGTGTHWPYAIVTYENNNVLSKTVLKLNEGYSGGLTVQNPDNLALTWTSDNTSVATVSSTGTVTGVNAGTTTVRVSSADNSITASCTVHVVIADGVYYIKNASSGKYLENTGGNVIVVAQDTSANTKFNQLWKITYVGNGRYAIRPMDDTSEALTIGTSSYIAVADATLSNAALPSSYLWTIGRDGSGLYFQQDGASNKTITTQANGTTTIIYPGTYSTGTACHWTLEGVKGIFLRDTETNEIITPDTVKYIELGDSLSYSELEIGYEYYGSLIGGLTWSSSNNTVASVSNYTGIVVGQTSGKTVITVNAVLNSSTFYASYSIYVKAVPDGIYHIANRVLDGYIQVDNDTSQFTSGAAVELCRLSNLYNQRWSVNFLENGYYSIISAESGHALSVSADCTTSADAIIVQENYTGAYRQQWMITQTDTGYFKIKARSSECIESDLSMCANNAVLGDTSEFGIIQDYFLDDANRTDEWYFVPDSVQLSTPNLRQQTSSWCWVTSAQMLSRTLSPTAANTGNMPTILSEQRKAVYHVFGDTNISYNDYDWTLDSQNLAAKGGIYTDVANAAAYLSELENYEITYTGFWSPCTEQQLMHFMTDGYPVARLHALASHSSLSSITLETLPDFLETVDVQINFHVNVIYGMRWDSNLNCYIYQVLDPSLGVLEYTYQQLMWQQSSNGQSDCYEFWLPTVTVKTEYSSHTFLGDIASEDHSSNP